MKKIFNSTPDIQEIEYLLKSARFKPGNSFYLRMQSAPWANTSTTQHNGFFNKRLLWAGTGAAFLLIVSLLFTPVGRALANEILHFFVRAPGNTLPLSPDEIVEIVPSATPQPTYFPTLLPADQVHAPTSQPTQPPTREIEEQAQENLDSISARNLVNFELSMPSALPKDYRLTNTLYDPDLQAIRFTYASPTAGSGEFFSLTQGTNLEPLNVGGNAAVERLQINQHEVEWVQGGWFVMNGADTAVWENDTPLTTLRWEENGVTFELIFMMNETFSPAYLDKDDMQFIVEHITSCAGTSGNEKYTCEIQQASAAAGFTPWQFEQAPEYFSYNTMYYLPGLTAIWYSSPAGELGILQSTQNFTALETSDWFSVPEEAIQQVHVGELPAEYVNGGFTAKPGEDQAVWQPDSGQIRLRWKNGDWWFQIVKWGSPEMQPQELADLATWLSEDPAAVNSGTQDQALETKVGEAYLDIKAAEADYGKPIQSPAIIPEGLPFSHARLITEETAMLFYGNFAEDKMRSDGAVMMFTQMETPITIADFPQEAIKQVTVNGEPATLISGSMNVSYNESGEIEGEPIWENDTYTLTLHWHDSENYFVLYFYAGYHSEGMRLSEEELIRIAESVQ